MQVFFSILIGLVGLGIVVFVHELGHFLVARLVGVEVEAFAVGWGPAFFRWKPGRTEYRLCWLPLGGYCKMKGESYLVQALTDPKSTPIPEPGSFFAATPLRRIVISLAGPVFNLLTAILVLSLLSLTGVPQNTPEARIVLASQFDHTTSYPADEAGLKTGDWLLSVNGKKVASFRDIQMDILASGSKPVQIEVLRDGKTMDVTVVPRWNERQKAFLVGVYPWIDPVVKKVTPQSAAQIAGILPNDKILAINDHPTPFTQAIVPLLTDRNPSYQILLERNGQKIKTQLVPDIVQGQPKLGLEYALPYFPASPLPFVEAFGEGLRQTQAFLTQMIDGLVQLLTGKLNPAESLSGPLLIAYYVGEVASQSFLSGWGEGVGAVANFLSFISLALFLMNLLPLPALDGGNVVVHFVEVFRKKPWNPRTLIRFQQIGVFLILVLVIFTTYNNMAFLMQPK